VRRVGKLLVVAFVLICAGVFAVALYGGLMDESAFTEAAQGH
jgi:FlaG/FlaF family flagellin (archaellin)